MGQWTCHPIFWQGDNKDCPSIFRPTYNSDQGRRFTFHVMGDSWIYLDRLCFSSLRAVYVDGVLSCCYGKPGKCCIAVFVTEPSAFCYWRSYSCSRLHDTRHPYSSRGGFNGGPGAMPLLGDLVPTVVPPNNSLV